MCFCSQEVRDHKVSWDAKFSFPCKMMANASTGVMEKCILRISIRKECKGGRSFTKVSLSGKKCVINTLMLVFLGDSSWVSSTLIWQNTQEPDWYIKRPSWKVTMLDIDRTTVCSSSAFNSTWSPAIFYLKRKLKAKYLCLILALREGTVSRSSQHRKNCILEWWGSGYISGFRFGANKIVARSK